MRIALEFQLIFYRLDYASFRLEYVNAEASMLCLHPHVCAALCCIAAATTHEEATDVTPALAPLCSLTP
jgi:hypothetical protein